jgi:hypothetical protein
MNLIFKVSNEEWEGRLYIKGELVTLLAFSLKELIRQAEDFYGVNLLETLN